MPVRTNKKLFPNPFYVLLLVSSTLFVVTTLAYLVVPGLLSPARGLKPDLERSKGVMAFLRAFDRNAPLALAIEVAVMLLAGFLAMATDRLFPEKS